MDVGEYVKYYREILTPQECDYIIDAEDDLKWKHFSYDAGVERPGRPPPQIGGDKQKETGLHQQQNRYKSWVTEDHFLYDVVKSGFEKVAEKYSTDFPLFSVQKMADFRINRYSECGYMSSHLDNIIVMDKHQYGYPQVSALLYLNDDYEGGEFHVADKIILPEAGSGIILPSNFMFPHEAKEVTKGTRWSIVTWLM